MHEAQLHARNAFLTLTYDDKHLPYDGGLVVADLQKFWKRCRKAGLKVRYLACGEYGERTLRPHYHACLFGEDFRADRLLVRTGRHELWTNNDVLRLWGKGHVSVGALSFESAAYVARYVMDKVSGEPAKARYLRTIPETGSKVSVRPEFVVMSRRPGLGAEWFKRFHADVFPRDEVVHQGRKLPVPKFYDGLLGEMDPAFLEGVKRERVRRANALPDADDSDRMFAREVILNRRRLRRDGVC